MWTTLLREKVKRVVLSSFVFQKVFRSECVDTSPSRKLVHRHCSFTHDQTHHVFRRPQNLSPDGHQCMHTTRPLSGDFTVFLVLGYLRWSLPKNETVK